MGVPARYTVADTINTDYSIQFPLDSIVMVLRPFTTKESNEISRVLMKCDLVNPPDCLVHTFFRVEEIEGKGLGWKANEDISPGTLIHVEKPLFSIRIGQAIQWTRIPRRLLMQEIKRLTAAELQKLLHLHSGQEDTEEGNDPGQKVTEEAHITRFLANNFQMTGNAADGKSDQGIFVRAARLNHSCLPNVWVNWNRDLERTELPGLPGFITVYAIRSIKRDEEVVMDYQNGDYRQPRKNRRATLKDTYNFTCQCPACEEGNRSELSDIRRAKMRNHLTVIRNNGGGDIGSRETQREAIENMIQSLNSEGLSYPQLATFYGKLADWWIDERRLSQSGGFALEGSEVCRTKGLEAARLRLESEIIAIGEDTEEVRSTMEQIAKLA